MMMKVKKNTQKLKKINQKEKERRKTTFDKLDLLSQRKKIIKKESIIFNKKKKKTKLNL